MTSDPYAIAKCNLWVSMCYKTMWCLHALMPVIGMGAVPELLLPM
jgi:hypothetical protein